MNEADKKQELKTKAIIDKQNLALIRIEEQKIKQKNEALIKKELFQIKKDLAELNAKHKNAREKYTSEKLKEKLSFMEERTSKFAAFNEDMKKKRLNNQTDSQLQREKISEAMQQMAIWKVYDLDVINGIIANPKSSKGPSAEELIRRKAAENSLSQSKMFSSFSNFDYR